MKRPLLVALAAAVISVGVIMAVQQRGTPGPAPATAYNPGNYVASDIALLATTGRPQLVELFHPG